MADELGFKIHNRFYPLVRFEDFEWGDFSLSRKLTGISNDELLSTRGDSMLLQQALIAVAICHSRRDLNHEQIVEFLQRLKPNDVEEVGFEIDDDLEDEVDASPKDENGEVKLNSSSPSSDTPSEPNLESEIPEESGLPGLAIGSPE